MYKKYLMYIPAAFGGGNVQVFMLNYCLGINTEKISLKY